MSLNGDRGEGNCSRAGGESRDILGKNGKKVKRLTQQLKFAAKVCKSPPCVGAVCLLSGGLAPPPLQPQQVLAWQAGRASVVNDPREDFGERRNENPSSETLTPRASCALSPTTRHPLSHLPVPIQEEGTGSSASDIQYPDYVNLPCMHVDHDPSASDSDASAVPGHPLCQRSSPHDFLFNVNGELRFGGILNDSDSGIPESDAEMPRTPQYMKLAQIRPNSCEVQISSLIAVSLSDENGICVEEPECVVQYWKNGGRQLEFERSGRRGMNKYEVETYTPCFATAGERIVLILTQDKTRVITMAQLDVIPRTPANQYNIFVIPSSSEGSVSDAVGQVVNIVSNQVNSSDENEGPLICGTLHCVGGGQNQSTEFAHGLLDFALNGECGGLPPPMSLRHLLASLPNLRAILETYHRAAGSLQHLVDVVRRQCTQQAVVRDIEFLVDQCNQETANDEQCRSQTPVSVENDSQCLDTDPIISEKYDSAPEQLESTCHVYDEVFKSQEEQSDVTCVNHEYALPTKNIQPPDNGLRWPSKLYHISEKTRVGLLTQVRDKTLSVNRAIENARDYMYATKPMSAPASPILTKKRKKARKKSSRQYNGGIGVLELLKKTASLITSNKSVSDSQSGLSTDDANLKVQSRHRKNKKIRSEEEQQQIRRKLSASSGDTLVGETSSVSTTATFGTNSLASESSNEQKEDSRNKQTNMEPTRIKRMSSDSAIADVSPEFDIHWNDCVTELKDKIRDKLTFC